MAPRARAGRARGRARERGGSTRNAPKRKDDGVPDVYRELMQETGESSRARHEAISADESQSRPRKRPRRQDERIAPRAPSRELEDSVVQVPSSPVIPALPTQTTIDDSESELEFEDVELGGTDAEHTDEDGLPNMSGLEEGFSVTVPAPGKTTPARAKRKGRKPITSAERSIRLAVHKMHICYLLYHTFYRNTWCNDEVTQAILKQMATSRIVQLLNPDSRASQAQSSSFFLLGLNQLTDLFHSRFKITSLGMRRSQWLVEGQSSKDWTLDERTEKPLERADFRRAASNLQGSADLGAQLFCCLLRAVGVEARLICSMQVLGFASAAEVAPPTNVTPVKKTVYVDEEEETPKPPTNGTTPRRIARIGQPRTTAPEPVSIASPRKESHVERPSYPIFWVEAFNSAHQKWTPVDPICTHTVNKPSRLEPGINDPKNCMSYVIAFEEDGVARDVTRRYTKAFTAKTRKLRVESAEGGANWLRKALKLFRRPKQLDRDALEDAELTARAAQEGMPKNVQDFKNHPLYALERHLKRNEVIHPKNESGRINAGTANNPKFESVYRRANVHIVKSADKWFRLGRELKIGEQPMKRAIPRRGTRVRESPLDAEEIEDPGVGLYAAFQTQVYVPPAVGGDGKIPKNQYGNIDIYVPSMIPEGAVWVRMPEAKHAAKLLRIDYADAVTGFDFKGRHGTARIDGVVVAEEYFEAMEVTCDAIREGRTEEIEANKSHDMLRLWRRFLVGLREVARIDAKLRDEDKASPIIDDEQMEHDDAYDGGGGFMPDEADDGDGFMRDDEGVRPAPARRRPQRSRKPVHENNGGFLDNSGDESEGGGGFVADSSDNDTGSGGGFVPEDETMSEDDIGDGDDYGAGGFLPDAHEDGRAANTTSDQKDVQGEETNDTPIDDDTPFGFASIRIPELGRRLLDREERFHDTGLPRIIRGMKRSLLQEEATAVPSTNITPESVAEPSHSRIDQAIEELEVPESPPVHKPEITLPMPRSPGSPVTRVTNKPVVARGDTSASQKPAAAASKSNGDVLIGQSPPPEDPPLSSYEYDEEMLLEDPDDEDAEPEWLV